MYILRDCSVVIVHGSTLTELEAVIPGMGNLILRSTVLHELDQTSRLDHNTDSLEIEAQARTSSTRRLGIQAHAGR